MSTPDRGSELAALEQVAMDAFARVRGDTSVLGRIGAIGVDLCIVRGVTKLGAHGPIFTVQLRVWEGDSIRDIKEQEVMLVPIGGDDERTPAYLEGLALGIKQRVERGDRVDSLMPYDFIPNHAFRNPAHRTVADFASCVTNAPGPDASPNDFSDLSGTEPIAVNSELERAIADEPERLENHLVYADWLTERGDPRGELITCSLPTASVAARQRAGQILVANRRYLAGNFLLVDDSRYDEYMGVAWALGWIENDICRRLPASPLLARVSEVDLSMGVMTDAGVDTLVAGRYAFRNVTKLDVSDNCLTDAGITALLDGMGAHMIIEAGMQKRYDDDRYVTVGE